MVEEGSPAPDFELQDDEGDTVTLSALRGKPVVLYFYPRDDTPGCTTEACEFRDAYDRFREQGVEILGVSPDTEASHPETWLKCPPVTTDAAVASPQSAALAVLEAPPVTEEARPLAVL